ncbi:MAG: phage regulatory CII family protein [Gammaproteobacteria bacterium]|nr:phage regulatory CII family protein [Gammaproteobacteria bacterium]
MSINHYSAIDEARYSLVHDFPGGAKALAPLVGMNPGTLSNKVNPQIDTHHLTVDESVVIQNTADDRQLIEAEAHVLGGVFIQTGDFSDVSDVELIDKFAAWVQDIGETSGAIRSALAAHSLSKDHLKIIHREIHEDYARAMELFKRLETYCDE